ncbi:hypothetical protein [Gordonia zhaorongruii]|uniref:hypothetical protein n=1 Tax=Gordonia zhaorongruii TaxID=2597659 RepID=UPI00104D9A13|nr:hypothetical protein [Gordonia zhaorongruii]
MTADEQIRAATRTATDRFDGAEQQYLRRQAAPEAVRAVRVMPGDELDRALPRLLSPAAGRRMH